MPILINYFIAGLIGILLNIFAIKIPNLKRLNKAANHTFSFKEYWADDWYGFIASVLTVIAFIWGWNEIITIKPELAKYVNLLFIFVGFTGASIALSLLSVATNKITAIIDIKTNVADGIQPPVNAGNIEGAKEISKEDNTASIDQTIKKGNS